MTRIIPPQEIVLNLKQHLGPRHPWYMTYEDAYKRAIRYSGVDFEHDITKWEEWFAKYPEVLGRVYRYSTLKVQCELLIKNLRQEIAPQNNEYVAPEHALALLVEKTGQDFGDDGEAWEDWVTKILSEDTE